MANKTTTTSSSNIDQKQQTKLIIVEDDTKYFSASSAWVQYSDGNEHDFLPLAIADSSKQTIEFTDDRPIGVYLNFFYNFTNNNNDGGGGGDGESTSGVEDNGDRRRMDDLSSWDKIQAIWYGNFVTHETHIVLELPPKGYEDEYDWQWKISQAWKTPNFKWEWLGIGWKEGGLITLPLGDWDVLHCDNMEFYIGNEEIFDKLILTNVTLGAYLPTGYNVEDLQVYSPCGTRSCHVINNEVFCRGIGLPDSALIIPFIVLLMILCQCTYACPKLYRVCKAKIVRWRVEAVDQELMEVAQLKANAWEEEEEDAVAYSSTTLVTDVEEQKERAYGTVETVDVTNEGVEVVDDKPHTY